MQRNGRRGIEPTASSCIATSPALCPRAQDDEAVAAAAALWLDRNGLSQPVWGEQPLPLPQQQAAAPSEATLSRLENRYGGGAMPVFKPGASTIGADNLGGARGGDMPVATFHTVTTMSMRHVR